MPAPILTVYMLGKFQIQYGEMPLADPLTPRLQSLIAYLLLHRHTAISRQQLAFCLWPETTDRQARNNLRTIVHRLRYVFPDIESFLDLEGATLSWRPDASVWLDVTDFETRLEQAETGSVREKPELLAAALALYEGDLLPDFYDDWVMPPRERLRQRYLDALSQLAELLEAKREYAAATETTRRLLQEDPLQERVYRRLMRLQALSGDLAGALYTYHRCAARLEQELGVEPSPATQTAYKRLLSQQALPEPASVSRSPRQLPLVARDKAWQALLAGWRVAAAGAPQVVIVSGEAGIGKTRLTEEFLIWAARQGIATLSAACFATTDHLPLGPVADWLRSEAMQRALPALTQRWRSEVARILPELLAADLKLETPRPMTEAWQQQHLFMALVEAVMAAGDPLLLFLDDLHWADANTLSWLHFLAQHKGGKRFLLLATIRTEEVAPGHPLLTWQQELARAISVRTVSLGRLDETATATLAAHLLGQELETEAIDALFRATEGNPLFTVEMARAGLKQSEDRLPDKVRSVIEFRLNRLGPQAQELVGLAAIIGRRFTFPLLAAAGPGDQEAVVRSLDELWQRQIVREQGEETYDFSHDKIREVALTRLSSARRRWWHERVAVALAQLFAGELEAVHGQIGAHWEAAGQPQKAADHYLQGARAASLLYAHAEAVRQLQRTLALLPVGHPRLFEIHTQLGGALVALGRHEEAAAAFEQAGPMAGDALNKVRLLNRHIDALSGGGRYLEATEKYDEAMALMETIPTVTWDGEIWRIWLDLQFSQMGALYFSYRGDEMQRLSAAVAEPLERHGSAWQRSQYSAFLASTRFLLLRFQLTNEEVAQQRTALRWAREAGDENLICHQQFGAGFTLLWAGQVAEAVDELRQVAEQAERIGNLPLQGRCLTYLGIAYRILGDEGRVRQTVEKGAPVVKAVKSRPYLGAVEALRAWLAWRAGEEAGASSHARVALKHWGPDEVPFPFQWLARLPLMAVALDAGQTEQAVAHARVVLLPSQQRLLDLLTQALEAGVAADNLSAAAAHLREARHLAQQHGYLDSPGL